MDEEEATAIRSRLTRLEATVEASRSAVLFLAGFTEWKHPQEGRVLVDRLESLAAEMRREPGATPERLAVSRETDRLAADARAVIRSLSDLKSEG